MRATGIAVLSPRIDIANARVELESGCVANLTASRVSAERVRKLRAFLPSATTRSTTRRRRSRATGWRGGAAAAQRRIVADDLPVERAEPLRRELEAFVAACRGEARRWSTAPQGAPALATALGGRRRSRPASQAAAADGRVASDQES